MALYTRHRMLNSVLSKGLAPVRSYYRHPTALNYNLKNSVLSDREGICIAAPVTLEKE